MTKFILVIGDLHVGSAFAVFPDGFKTSTGATLILNEGQQYLLECWQHFLKSLPQKIDKLVLNGDLCDGQNLSEESRGLVETDPIFQARAAHQLLKPILRRTRAVYMTRGSRYHTGRGVFLEEALGDLVGAVPDSSGHRTRPWLHMEAAPGVLFDIAHHTSGMIRYQNTSLEREVGFFLERVAKRGEAPPEYLVIARSHVHVGYRAYEEEHALAVLVPPWKLQDDFAAMGRTPNRWVPENLGSLGFRVFDKPKYGHKVLVIPYLYAHPALTVV